MNNGLHLTTVAFLNKSETTEKSKMPDKLNVCQTLVDLFNCNTELVEICCT